MLLKSAYFLNIFPKIIMVIFLESLKKYSIIAFGSFLFALSVNLFTLPLKIVSGGIGGVATILYHLFGISTGVTVGILNIIIIIFALKSLGKEFVMDSMIAIILIPLFMAITEKLPPLTDDIFIAALFGGVILGVGIGMAFSQGGTTGGVDILSRMSQKKYPHLSIGILMLILDLVIIGCSIVTIGNVNLAFYGIFSLIVSTTVIDLIIGKLNRAQLILAVVKDSLEIEQAILQSINRGVTTLSAVGAYSKEEKTVLMCAMKPKQAEAFKNTIRKYDPDAFLIVTDSKEILGNGFHYYR